ncbi:MAG: glycerophosphodiester phosphodiesterase [Caldilineaceae bacterium]
MLLPIPVPPHFRIIAHRGASAYAPENTRPAFQLALDMSVTEVELDTRLTADGVIALSHDNTLARYGHGEQTVEALTWAELAALDMGSWHSPHLFGGVQMLTLAQLFAEFGNRFIYHVELKGDTPDLPAAVHRLIEQYNLYDSCIITSFMVESLAAMRQISPHARLGWLIRQIDDNALQAARDLNLFQLCPMAKNVTPAMVQQARQVVPEVRAWGVNGETVASQSRDIIALIQNVLAAGCDGMTINWPDWVKKG